MRPDPDLGMSYGYLFRREVFGTDRLVTGEPQPPLPTDSHGPCIVRGASRSSRAIVPCPHRLEIFWWRCTRSRATCFRETVRRRYGSGCGRSRMRIFSCGIGGPTRHFCRCSWAEPSICSRSQPTGSRLGRSDARRRQIRFRAGYRRPADRTGGPDEPGLKSAISSARRGSRCSTNAAWWTRSLWPLRRPKNDPCAGTAARSSDGASRSAP